jgi:hypothetical protein
MSGILGADQFGRIIPRDSESDPAEPDAAMIGGRPAEDWEADLKRSAILADRARQNAALLSGLVRS